MTMERKYTNPESEIIPLPNGSKNELMLNDFRNWAIDPGIGRASAHLNKTNGVLNKAPKI